MPAAAKGTSEKSAVAFVRYAVEVLNFSTSALDTKVIRSISSPTCKACESVATGIEELIEAGGSIEGGRLRVVELGAVGSEIDGQQLVQVVVDAKSQTIKSDKGAPPEALKGGRVFYDFRLVATGRQWRIGEIIRGDT